MHVNRFAPYLLIAAAVLTAGMEMSADTQDQRREEKSAAAAGSAAGLSARGTGIYALPVSASRIQHLGKPLAGLALQPGFPDLYRTAALRKLSSLRFEVPGEEDMAAQNLADSVALPVLANNQILAFYGKPGSKSMGILGEYSKEDLARMLDGYAKLYDDVNGPTGVVTAFYLIYGTCWPGGEIGYLKDSVVQSYIDYAAAHNMLVFVDHQIGRYGVEDAMKHLLPFLKYPNVHIAIDPEWRTTLPMKEIGRISADELNAAQKMMSDYIETEGIPGDKMLVVHQFRYSMIQGREKVKASYSHVLLVHTADGFGSPQLKRNTYAMNSLAANMPLKGFKLFFKTAVPGAGWDNPLLTPSEVLALDPRPALIIYQ